MSEQTNPITPEQVAELWAEAEHLVRTPSPLIHQQATRVLALLAEIERLNAEVELRNDMASSAIHRAIRAEATAERYHALREAVERLADQIKATAPPAPQNLTADARGAMQQARRSALYDAAWIAQSALLDADAEVCDRKDDEGDDLIEEALAEMGREARAIEACSICHASVRPDRRDRHLDWHASLLREVERGRLPEVFGAMAPERGERVLVRRGKCTCGEVTPENRLGHADGCRYFADSVYEEGGERGE